MSVLPSRRNVQTVRQTSSGYNLSYLLEKRVLQFWPFLTYGFCYIAPKRHAYTCYLKTVGKAVVYKDASRERKHLGLVLKSAKWSRKNQSVVVAFELRPLVFPVRVEMLLPEPFIRNKLFPIHHTNAKVTFFCLKNYFLEVKMMFFGFK